MTSFLKVSLFLILLLKVNVFAVNDNCKDATTTEPPFWVVVGDPSMKHKGYENLKDERLKNFKAVPKDSIVFSLKDRPWVNGPGGKYMPIVVASTPTTDQAEHAKDLAERKKIIAKTLRRAGYPGYIQPTRPVRAAEPGDIGYIYYGEETRIKDPKGNKRLVRKNPSIVPPRLVKDLTKHTSFNSDFEFVVKKNSKLVNIPGAGQFDQDHILDLAIEDGQYQIKKCPDPNNPGSFTIQYMFHVYKIKKDGFIGHQPSKNFFFNPEDHCQRQDLSSLMPVDDRTYRYLYGLTKITEKLTKKSTGISDLLYMTEADRLVQMPQGHEILKIGDQCYTKGPYGSYHYIGATINHCERSSAKSEQQGDSMTEPHVACAVANGVLRKMKEKCPDCKIQWGNIFMPYNKNLHTAHAKGTCIDFRPIKKSYDDIREKYKKRFKKDEYNLHGACHSTWKDIYDREKTKLLVEALLDAGVSSIVFQDKRLRDSIDKETKNDLSSGNITQSYFIKDKVTGERIPGRKHVDHIHACFPTLENFEKIPELNHQIDKLTEKRRTKARTSQIARLRKERDRLHSLKMKVIKSCFSD